MMSGNRRESVVVLDAAGAILIVKQSIKPTFICALSLNEQSTLPKWIIILIKLNKLVWVLKNFSAALIVFYTESQ